MNGISRWLWFGAGLLFALAPMAAQISTELIGKLPEPVANNAVVEGFVGDSAYVYSFAGIDSTKTSAGIHLRSYRVNVATGFAERLPDVPDTLGKVAAGASRIGDIIYVIGGYHVFVTGGEKSSDRVHRFSVSQNAWLPDGAKVPVPIDDHVQAVWRDSLIYVVTGWSERTNVQDVQIYDPATDTWRTGTQLPNLRFYGAFGPSGTIVADTLYYFGGARMGTNFPITPYVRRGVIDSADPTQIAWTWQTPDNAVVGYRAAATASNGELYWLGGSDITYNFDGLSYASNRGVPPSNEARRLVRDSLGSWVSYDAVLPMDLRGVGEVDDSVRVLVGGMMADQVVSDEVLAVTIGAATSTAIGLVPGAAVRLFPNPTADVLSVTSDAELASVELFDAAGRRVLMRSAKGALSQNLSLAHLAAGTYTVVVTTVRGERQKVSVVRAVK